MLKSAAERCRTGWAVTALFVIFFATETASFDRPLPQAACAALDIHLLDQVEKAGEMQAEEPERLFVIFETLMAARQLCRNGFIAEGMRLYDSVSLEPGRLAMLR